MAVKSIELPLINLSGKHLVNPIHRKEETRKLINCFSGVGFCLITGLDGYSRDELFKWTKWFFCEVSEEERFSQLAIKSFNPSNSNIYRGYFPLAPGLLSHKQGYEMGPVFSEEDIATEEGNPFMEATPKLTLEGREKETEQFYEVMYRHRKILNDAADLIMSLIAEAGGESSDFFAPMFAKRPIHTFRPIRYPKRVDNIPDGAYLPDGRILSTPAHMDSGFLTLLQTFGYPGLELELDGVWHAVDQLEDALVVNLGEQMTAMSNGRFKSTIHRVVDIGQDRFSLPFFYEPMYDANIHTKIPKALLPSSGITTDEEKGGKLPYATFLLHKLPIYVEHASICNNLPDWFRRKYLDGYTNVTNWATEAGIEVDGVATGQQ